MYCARVRYSARRFNLVRYMSSSAALSSMSVSSILRKDADSENLLLLVNSRPLREHA